MNLQTWIKSLEDERRAFQTALIHAPWEPANYGVYADWCEDHGDDALASQLRSHMDQLIEMNQVVPKALAEEYRFAVKHFFYDMAEVRGHLEGWAFELMRLFPYFFLNHGIRNQMIRYYVDEAMNR